jgi:hypothetical protein
MPHVAGDMSDKTVAHAVKSAAVARRCFFPTRGGALRALAHRPGDTPAPTKPCPAIAALKAWANSSKRYGLASIGMPRCSGPSLTASAFYRGPECRAVTAQFSQRNLTNPRAKTSVRRTMRNLKLRSDIREPVRGPVENPRLDRFIRSRHDQRAQAQHDKTQELLAVFAGLQ